MCLKKMIQPLSRTPFPVAISGNGIIQHAEGVNQIMGSVAMMGLRVVTIHLSYEFCICDSVESFLLMFMKIHSEVLVP